MESQMNCNTEELYRLHRKRLLLLIQSKVDDAQKAEDLLHDSFEKLEQCCRSGCECERPKSYLFRMTLNLITDFFRSSRKRFTPIDHLQIKGKSVVPFENESSCDLFKCIDRFLEDFSPENREAYLKVDVQQMPQIKVAQELGIPISTLKSRVQRTRKHLRKRIEDCCPDFKEKCI